MDVHLGGQYFAVIQDIESLRIELTLVEGIEEGLVGKLNIGAVISSKIDRVSFKTMF